MEALRERVLTLDGLTVRTLSSPCPATPHRGALEPRVFVLVHGIGVSHRYLARLHKTLAESATVHSLCLPGFGGLPKPEREVDISVMATLIGDVLDTIGVRRCVLIGHSMGCQWVVETAIARPELADAVVVMGPVADSAHRSEVAQAWALAVDTVGEPLTGNLTVLTDYLRCGPAWYRRQSRHMLEYRPELRVAALDAPLLVLRGGDDPIAGMEWCRELRDNARDSVLVTVPGRRHLVQWTAPRATASAIRTFVESRAGSTRA
jgi:pimeloyl-ACP methyl ester carboxylesterase